METNFIDKLYHVYRRDIYTAYQYLENFDDLQKVAFTGGILSILLALKINIKEIKLNNGSLQDCIDDILKNRYLKTELEKSEEETIKEYFGENNVIHDKDNVSFREYVPSGEGNTF